jgi:hypothetical protein
MQSTATSLVQRGKRFARLIEEETDAGGLLAHAEYTMHMHRALEHEHQVRVRAAGETDIVGRFRVEVRYAIDVLRSAL